MNGASFFLVYCDERVAIDCSLHSSLCLSLPFFLRTFFKRNHLLARLSAPAAFE